MNALPYRLASRTAVPSEPEPAWLDTDLLLPATLLWVVSLVRVVGAVLRHETFGAEATLALVVGLCVPVLLVRASKRPRRLARP
jgi:hypothetical protein